MALLNYCDVSDRLIESDVLKQFADRLEGTVIETSSLSGTNLQFVVDVIR